MKTLMVAVMVLTSATVIAETGIDRSDPCIQVTSGTQGEIPVPFEALNRRVELADGASYVLIGTFMILGVQPVLKVDLQSHYWLANPQRCTSPHYGVQIPNIQWLNWVNRRMQVQVKAASYIEVINGELKHQIRLIPVGDPKILD